jgi:hypothetical protein
MQVNNKKLEKQYEFDKKIKTLLEKKIWKNMNLERPQIEERLKSVEKQAKQMA